MPMFNNPFLNALIARIEALEIAFSNANFVNTVNAQSINGNKNFNDKVIFAGNNSRNSAEFGSFGIQGYALNNCWLGDNMYFDGGQFRFTQNGNAAFLYFLGGGINLIHSTDTGSAGDSINLTNVLTSNNTGVTINGKLFCPNFPLSPAGLAAGTLWRNGDTINVV